MPSSKNNRVDLTKLKLRVEARHGLEDFAKQMLCVPPNRSRDATGLSVTTSIIWPSFLSLGRIQ